ncbi:DUF4339 domain-containing protein [Flavobacterium sp. 83]|jgi:hypothetical protein|uniref:DUF4339 domain-containing protein n=1 Tax=Flavobacterium sp. 83 TaxID=1131812 RepID=UPI0005568A1E|nr:DUF4339 domain-containing protein [Flavobacterium sp. 83]
MKTYYIHNGTENSGPFLLDELKAKKITKTTLIWFEGMDEWKYAGDIPELRSILAVIPPPLKNIPPLPKEKEKVVSQTILGMDKSIFFWACGISTLIVATLIFNTYQDNRSLELEEKNKQTEFQNQQIEMQQKQTDEEKIQIAIQEKINNDRLSKQKKDSVNNRISEIKELLIVNNANLEEDQNKLIDAKDFKLLRSENEREDQINLIEDDIIHWQKEIKKLENEVDRLYLELETIH